MFDLLVAAALAFVLVVMKAPLIIDFCHWFEIYDESDSYRKHHGYTTPRLGGIAIFSAFIVVSMRMLNLNKIEDAACLLSTSAVFFIGLKDDVVGHIAPIEKACMQLCCAMVIVFWGSCEVSNLYGLFGVYQVTGWISVLLSISIIIFMMNAFNLIDGVDGLAGTIGLFANICFGLSFWYVGDQAMAMLSFALAGATAGFLKFNYIPGKLFMGDSGAMVIGFITITSALKLMNLIDTIASEGSMVNPMPAIIVAILILPTFDTCRVFSIRILKGKSPFLGDRNHIHHKLQLLGFHNAIIVSILLIVNLLMLILVLYLHDLGNATLIILQFSICMLLNTWLSYKKGKRLSDGYKFRDVLLKDTFR